MRDCATLSSILRTIAVLLALSGVAHAVTGEEVTAAVQKAADLTELGTEVCQRCLRASVGRTSDRQAACERSDKVLQSAAAAANAAQAAILEHGDPLPAAVSRHVARLQRAGEGAGSCSNKLKALTGGPE